MTTGSEYEKDLQTRDSETFPGNTNHAESGTRQLGALKTTHNGLTMLSPEPSSDVNDPLNWSQSKKMSILLVVSATAFLADFGSSMGAVTSVVQSNLL